MVKNRAEALVFRAGANVELIVGGVPRPVSSRPATEEQIITVLSDALGAAYTPGLAGRRSFTYTAPTGPVSIEVDDGHEGLVVHVRAGGTPVAPAAAPTSRPAADMPTISLGGQATPTPTPHAPRSTPTMAATKGGGFGGTASVGGIPAHIDELFNHMLDMKASDIHLKSANIPLVRVDGSIMPMPGRPVLSAQQLETLIDPIMPDRNRSEFAESNDTDFAYELGRARMRCNVFRDMNGIGAVFRQIPSKILSAEDLKLPKAVLDLCTYDKGLVVVTGPTGSGKSTTLAAMIDWINTNRDDHIITIEDPIEFVHKDKGCLINQREVGTHTRGFKSALRAALREDPDIVLVGEMRDLETVAIAIETAETGHLVFGTLHTNTAPSTVDRLIDQFPADRQDQIRIMLSESLKGVVAQTLLKKKGGGRVAALEILIVTPAVANLIREGKTFQITSLMQTGRGIGMQMLNDALIDLVKNDIVEAQEAYDRAPHKKEFAGLLQRAGIKGPWNEEKTV